MASHTSVERGLDRSETSASTALHQLGAHLATDPEWIAAVSREIAEAVLREFPQLREDAELRHDPHGASMSASSSRSSGGAEPSEAAPLPTAIEHAYVFVRRGVPVDILLRAYQVGQASFIHALSTAVRDDRRHRRGRGGTSSRSPPPRSPTWAAALEI